MQARNIAIVDQAIIRDIESRALEGFLKDEKVPMDFFMPLAAISQMWVFALYEFLRTWRQRANEFIELGERYHALKETEQKAFLDRALADAERRESLIKIAPKFYAEQVGRITDPAFIAALKEYRAGTEDLFRQTETVRMPLAKHEVAKTRKKPLAAEAPGYTRMNYLTGAAHWDCVLTDGTVVNVDRRELADEFLGIEEDAPDEDDDDFEVEIE
jgi:hypothetical protein